LGETPGLSPPSGDVDLLTGPEFLVYLEILIIPQ
jgi:hypothetical protein